jgi:hypothetical protein
VSVPAAERTTPAATQGEPQSPDQSGASAGPEGNVDPTQTSSAAGEEQESRGPDYFREAFMRTRGFVQSAAPQAPPVSAGPVQESERTTGDPQAVPPSAEDASTTPATVLPRQREKPARTDAKPNVLTLTPEEYDRRVQSETDRRLAKMRADEQTRAEQERERQLRDENPYEYVRLLKDKEAELAAAHQRTAEIRTTLDQQIGLYDRRILDPIVGALPAEVRQKIIESVTEDGIPGREKIAKGALKALQDHWLQEGAKTARQRLAADQTFVKEILARYGGQREEPDTTRGMPVSSSPRPGNENTAVNDFIRQGAWATRQVSGR